DLRQAALDEPVLVGGPPAHPLLAVLPCTCRVVGLGPGGGPEKVDRGERYVLPFGHLQGAPEIPYGPVVIFQTFFREAPVALPLGVAGLKGDGLVEVVPCLFEVALP